MAESALEGLRPARLPADASSTLVDHLVTGAGLGLLLALVAIGIALAFSRRRADPRRVALRRIAGSEGLSAGERAAVAAAAVRDYAEARFGPMTGADEEAGWAVAVARRTGRPIDEAAALTAGLYAPAGEDDAERAVSAARAIIRGR